MQFIFVYFIFLLFNHMNLMNFIIFRYLDRFQRQDEKAKNFTDDVNSCISRQYSKFKFKFTGKSVIIFIIFESKSCKNIYKFLEKIKTHESHICIIKLQNKV